MLRSARLLHVKKNVGQNASESKFEDLMAGFSGDMNDSDDEEVRAFIACGTCRHVDPIDRKKIQWTEFLWGSI